MRPTSRQDEARAAKSVYLIDDHPVVDLGLRLAFSRQSRFQLTGTAADAPNAICEIGRRQPDAIVADLVLAGVVELSLIERCRTAARSSAIVVFSSLPPRLYERQALALGADAYLSKDNDLSMLVELLGRLVTQTGARAETAGQCPAIKRSEALLGVYLTDRETEIGQLLGGGLSISRIAQQICLSPKTVAAHRDNIRRKLGCRDSNELIARLAKLYAEDGHG